MKRRSAAGGARMIAPIAAALAIGILLGWLLHAYGPPRPPADLVRGRDATSAPKPSAPVAAGEARGEETRVPSIGPATTGKAHKAEPAVSAAAEPAGAIEELHGHVLRVPIDGISVDSFKGGYEEHRTGAGGHPHEAVDILSPRNTAVHAVEDGTIAKLFESKAGGHTVYQFDPSGRFCYYYAHLERYADGLYDGQPVRSGDVIGYVGTSGNAPPETPHLHFAVIELDAEKRWWRGQALDPYLVFQR